MANGRTASDWSLGREANLWPGTVTSQWDVTAVCTAADSYAAASAREADAAAERAAKLKIAKYSGLKDKCRVRNGPERTGTAFRFFF